MSLVNNNSSIGFYKTFKVFGDGSDKMTIITTDPDGNQDAIIVYNPLLEMISLNVDSHQIQGGWPVMTLASYVIRQNYKINMESPKLELVQGKELEKLFDPVLQKTISQLLCVVNKKFEERNK